MILDHLNDITMEQCGVALYVASIGCQSSYFVIVLNYSRNLIYSVTSTAIKSHTHHH